LIKKFTQKEKVFEKEKINENEKEIEKDKNIEREKEKDTEKEKNNDKEKEKKKEIEKEKDFIEIIQKEKESEVDLIMNTLSQSQLENEKSPDGKRKRKTLNEIDIKNIKSVNFFLTKKRGKYEVKDDLDLMKKYLSINLLRIKYSDILQFENDYDQKLIVLPRPEVQLRPLYAEHVNKLVSSYTESITTSRQVSKVQMELVDPKNKNNEKELRNVKIKIASLNQKNNNSTKKEEEEIVSELIRLSASNIIKLVVYAGTHSLAAGLKFYDIYKNEISKNQMDI
jgi:hypothetical protein